jgi:hypothetical protein
MPRAESVIGCISCADVGGTPPFNKEVRCTTQILPPFTLGAGALTALSKSNKHFVSLTQLKWAEQIIGPKHPVSRLSARCLWCIKEASVMMEERAGDLPK